MTKPEDLIREMVARQERAWNAGDAKEWSAPFADNAEFINIRGTVFRGRGEIEARHAEILSTFFSGSSAKVSLQSSNWVATGLALLRVTHEVTGYKALPPGIRETAKGTLVTVMTCVVKQTGPSAIEIIYAQNTAVANKENA